MLVAFVKMRDNYTSDSVRKGEFIDELNGS
jgi:hypothetical protein